MQVKRVTRADLDKTYCCISEVPESYGWAKSLPESRKWFETNLGKAVEGYHLLDGDKVVGLIYYAMSEKGLVSYEIEPNVASIYCTELLRPYLHKGYGRLMFDHMKSDLKKQGAKGIIVTASDFKEWMHYELFLKQGFKTIIEHAPFKTMYFPLNKERINIKILSVTYTPSKDKVEVTLFKNFFCPVGAYMYHLIKKVAQGFGDKVKIVEIEATRETMQKYGTAEPLFNGKIKLFGPAKEEDVKKAIQEEIDNFKR